MTSPSLFLAAFHHLPSQSDGKFAKIAMVKDIEKLWKDKNANALAEIGIEREAATTLAREIEAFSIDVLRSKLEAADVVILTQGDEAYSTLLKEIANPPPILYVRGAVENLNTVCLSVVGTRTMSRYGRQVIERIIPPLVASGITIVSGLAIGVDACAHQVTVDVGGRTIAVLGSGVDRITPWTNAILGKKILGHGGTILSEFPLGTEPANYTFPVRNRVIAGISRGTLIVEAKERSGSLITAKLALEQNREMFAVPGDIFHATSEGTNGLIRSGEAKLVTCAADILLELGLDGNDVTVADTLGSYAFDSAQEETVYHLLDKEGKETDALIRESGLPAHETTGALTMLEMKKLAKNAGGVWVRK